MRDLLLIRPRYFYLLFVPFVIIGALAIAFTNKSDLFLYFNKHYSPFGDRFFYVATWMGDGIFFLIVCLSILFINIKDGILGFISFSIAALTPQVLKKMVFTGAIRPVKYFEGDASIHMVEGVKHHFYHSFPSGHSVSIFALALFLTMVVKNKKWGLVFATIAIVTAYSRVYLAQHFFEDIYAGSCIGFASTLLAYMLFEKWIRSNKNLDRPLFSKKKKE